MIIKYFTLFIILYTPLMIWLGGVIRMYLEKENIEELNSRIRELEEFKFISERKQSDLLTDDEKSSIVVAVKRSGSLEADLQYHKEILLKQIENPDETYIAFLAEWIDKLKIIQLKIKNAK